MAPKTTKRGKENAPVKKFVDESDVEESDVPVLKKVKKTKDVDPLSSSSRPSEKDKDAGSLQKRLAAMTAERDRAVAERKEVAAQFEELSQLRASEAETLLEKFKKQTAAVAKAQANVIANQTALNDKLMSKVAELEQALKEQRAATDRAEDKAAAAEAPPALEGRLDGKSSKELHNEVHKLRTALKTKEDELSRLQREYDQEVAHSLKLQKEARPAASAASAASRAAPAVSSEESEKDHITIALYEDLTAMSVLRVAIRPTAAGKEKVFHCVQTADDRTFAFKLRLYKDDTYAKQLEFTPEGLEYEKDKAFISRLGPFAEGFIVAHDQAQAAWDQLRSRVSQDGEFKDPRKV